MKKIKTQITLTKEQVEEIVEPYRIYGFHEERYPIYSDGCVHELCSPTTAAEVNSLVKKILTLEEENVSLRNALENVGAGIRSLREDIERGML